MIHEPITAQEALNRNWQHFIVEGKPPGRVAGSCMYRTPDGCPCGIGILIPDEVYTVSFEGTVAKYLLRERSPHAFTSKWDRLYELFKPMSDRGMNRGSRYTDGSEFLHDLQKAHDGLSRNSGEDFSRFYADALRDLARKYDLDVPA